MTSSSAAPACCRPLPTRGCLSLAASLEILRYLPYDKTLTIGITYHRFFDVRGGYTGSQLGLDREPIQESSEDRLASNSRTIYPCPEGEGANQSSILSFFFLFSFLFGLPLLCKVAYRAVTVLRLTGTLGLPPELGLRALTHAHRHLPNSSGCHLNLDRVIRDWQHCMRIQGYFFLFLVLCASFRLNRIHHFRRSVVSVGRAIGGT